MRYIFPLFLFCFLLSAGCSKTTVILLPDEDGHVGEAIIEADGKSTPITSSAQTASTDGGNVSLFVSSQKSIDKNFGTQLKIHPEPPVSFLVHFASGADTPLENDDDYIPAIAAAFNARKNPSVTVIGHTDKTGDKELNDAISRRRAERVAEKLLKAGIPSQYMDIQNFGYGIPLFPYRNGILSEPRNRRVEIFIR